MKIKHILLSILIIGQSFSALNAVDADVIKGYITGLIRVSCVAGICGNMFYAYKHHSRVKDCNASIALLKQCKTELIEHVKDCSFDETRNPEDVANLILQQSVTADIEDRLEKEIFSEKSWGLLNKSMGRNEIYAKEHSGIIWRTPDYFNKQTDTLGKIVSTLPIARKSAQDDRNGRIWNSIGFASIAGITLGIDLIKLGKN